MKSKRIIFIVETTFNKRDYKRYGVETLTSRGLYVEIWDFSYFLNSNYCKNYTVPDPISVSSCRIFNNKKEVLSVLLELDNKKDTIFSLFTVKRKTKFIFNYFVNNAINFGFLSLGVIPSIQFRLSILQRIKNNIKKPKYLFKIFYERLLNYSRKRYFANFFIVGGDVAKIKAKQSKYYNEKSIIINAHAFDYDLYLEEKKSVTKRILEGKYAVMLDEYNLYHPDNLISGSTVNPKTYYRDLNNFFKYLEDYYGIDIVIAAHPRSHSEKLENSYGGRKKVYGKTIHLIKNSEMVLTHASTALNFGVLYNKPIIFLTSNDYSITYKNSINFAAKALLKSPIDVSTAKFSKTNYLEINEESYKLFIKLFIKSPNTAEISLWNIFANFIESKENNNSGYFN
tara:strand:- start:221 stop:1414 length:1194 start_codon:yes stop_codon:yes gene_type:complete